jgi:hypothetical protein
MQRWLAGQHIPLQSFRERYNKLPMAQDSTGAEGNLLITTVPHLLPVRNSEQVALRRWVERGNTLLVHAGLADTPEWSMGEGYDAAAIAHLAAISGMSFVQVTVGGQQVTADAAGPANDAAEKEPAPAEKDGDAPVVNSTTESTPGATTSPPPAKEDVETNPKLTRQLAQELASGARLTTPERHELVPNGVHPLLSGVRSVVALSEYPSEQFRAQPADVSTVLELARDKKADEPVLWLAQLGRGRVLVSGFGSIFTNKLLPQADNAQLLANIVSASVRGGSVIIDDAHQGGVSFYDAEAFFADARLHRTLWWLVALWLVFILGPQRIRVRPSGWQPVDITAFVRSTGGFLARVVRPAAVAQQLFAHFFSEVQGRNGEPHAPPDWQALESHAAVSPTDIRQLQDLYRRTRQGRRVDLLRLHNLLTRVRRATVL